MTTGRLVAFIALCLAVAGAMPGTVAVATERSDPVGRAPSAAATSVPWSVSLTVSATSVSAGTQVTLTATTNQDVATYYRITLEIWQGPEDVTPGNWLGRLSADQLAQCDKGTVCTLTRKLDEAGSRTFAALIVTRGGYLGNSGTLAASSPVKVTWGVAPTRAPTSNPPPPATSTPAPTRTPTPVVTATKTSTPTLTATVTPKAGLPLCPEALSILDGFGAERLRAAGITDPARTGILRGKDSLLGDFQLAIKSYNQRYPDDKAYVTTSLPLYGELGALNWLFSSNPAIGGPVAKAYVTGTEPKLVDAIKRLSSVRKAEGGSPLLTPGDVLELAIGLNGGNVNQAVLTAHNTLRALARGDGSGLLGVNGPSLDFYDSYLAKLRDGNENAGPWYHMFGTAYLEMVARGDWGPWLAAGGMTAGVVSGLVPGGPVLVALLASELMRRLPTQTALSRLANDAEQLYRENIANDKGQFNKPDPEKFCFNLWGAQLGRTLYDGLPTKSTRALRDFFSRFSVPSEPSPLIDAVGRVGSPRFVNMMGSPFSVQWNDGTMRMVLDQGTDPSTASLRGGVPMLLLPVLEEDSWGLVWFGPEHSAQTVTFEAAAAGAQLHFLRADTQTGETAVYEAVASRRGERFSVDLDPVTTAPALLKEDGSEIKPQIVTLQLTRGSGPGDSGADRGATRAMLALALVAAVAVLGGFVARGRRTRRRPPSAAGESWQEADFGTPVARPGPAAGPRRCGTCGAEALGANFCASCGAPAPAQQVRCLSCAAALDPGARFCGACGALVREAA